MRAPHELGSCFAPLQVLAALADALGLSPDDLHLAAGQFPPDLITGTVTRARLHQVLDAIQRIYGARG